MKKKIFLLILIPSLIFIYRHQQEKKFFPDISWDPRGNERLYLIRQQSTIEQFTEFRRSYQNNVLAWPGLKAMQSSFIWMQVLNAIHYPESYQGNYSWVFAQLHKILTLSPQEEIAGVASLASFYFVLSDDVDGATFFMQSLLQENPANWHFWFWSAFHALENLHDRQLAAELYYQASIRPGSPDYLLPLAVSLKAGESINDRNLRRSVIDTFPEIYREKLKEMKPEWF